MRFENFEFWERALHVGSYLLMDPRILGKSIPNDLWQTRADIMTQIIGCNPGSCERAALTLTAWVFDWRHLRFEHVHGYDVDEHDPARTVQDILLVPDEGDCADTLTLEFPPERDKTKL